MHRKTLGLYLAENYSSVYLDTILTVGITSKLLLVSSRLLNILHSSDGSSQCTDGLPQILGLYLAATVLNILHTTDVSPHPILMVSVSPLRKSKQN